MTQQEINRRNEAIALYLGWTKTEKPSKLLLEDDWYRDLEGSPQCFNSMMFHSSYDWLIPVVEKLNNTKDIRISFEEDKICVCRIYHPDLLHDEPQYERGNYEPAIMNIFLAVSDYCLKEINQK